jgi:purine-binding chemotaxis protein CheW
MIATHADSHQYLSFGLQEEAYCIDILMVQEIRALEKVKPIPNAPEFVLGVINLRGQIIPVVDLRKRFNLSKPDTSQKPVTIYIELENLQKIGIVVDYVSDVHEIYPSMIKKNPDITNTVDTTYLDGIVTVDDAMIAIINMNKVFEKKELSDLSNLISD